MTTGQEPTLGVHLLETITRGMYSQPLHSLREYVQNAYDSIREARRSNILTREDGQIRIFVNKEDRSVRIRDNGAGLSPEDAAVYLVDLGNSGKARTDQNEKQNAGFRGIGRMAGITYCRKLVFETSNGNGKKCTVVFDAKSINELTSKGREPTTIVEAIRRNTDILEEEEKDGLHYLEVRLEGIRKDSPFLDDDGLSEYLSRVGPVPYDPSVWSFGPDILKFSENAEQKESLDHIQIAICKPDGSRIKDVRRPYKETLSAKPRGRNPRVVNVGSVVALPRCKTRGAGWWGWLAVHERLGQLTDIPFAGLRVYMHNIAIGDESIFRDLFTTKNHAVWCFGEIHITEHALTPNAQRDNFEDSQKWRGILAELRDETRLIDKEIRRESDERNTSVASFESKADGAIKKAKVAIQRGLESREEQEALVEQLQTHVERVERQKDRRRRSDDEKQRLEATKKRVEDAIREVRQVPRTGRDAAQAHLSKQSRNVLKTVQRVLRSELDDETFRRVDRKINDALKPGRKERS